MATIGAIGSLGFLYRLAYDPKAVEALPAADEAEQGATRARTGLETAAAHPVNRAVMSSQKGRFRCYFNGLMGFALRG